jgi:hypothetical protein
MSRCLNGMQNAGPVSLPGSDCFDASNHQLVANGQLCSETCMFVVQPQAVIVVLDSCMKLKRWIICRCRRTKYWPMPSSFFEDLEGLTAPIFSDGLTRLQDAASHFRPSPENPPRAHLCSGLREQSSKMKVSTLSCLISADLPMIDLRLPR